MEHEVIDELRVDISDNSEEEDDYVESEGLGCDIYVIRQEEGGRSSLLIDVAGDDFKGESSECDGREVLEKVVWFFESSCHTDRVVDQQVSRVRWEDFREIFRFIMRCATEPVLL